MKIDTSRGTDKPDIPYSIEMMADDTAGLLSALDIPLFLFFRPRQFTEAVFAFLDRVSDNRHTDQSE